MVLTMVMLTIMLAFMVGIIVVLGGTTLLAVFGDLIVFVAFVYWIVKMIQKKRHP